MAPRPASRSAQRGLALLGLLAVIVMVFAWILTSRLNAANQYVALDREHNAKVLAQARQALIGWMAINAATDINPGRLPCPEAINAIGTTSEGIAAPLVSPSTPNCATVGRLPWRTLGLEKLVDATGEPLWYAVSPGWMLQTSSTLLTINPDTVGSMNINGALDPTVVAVIIAPGPAMNVLAATGCTARAQSRATPAPAIDARDYVECFNAATPAFSTTGPSTSFNDQVLAIRTADVLPALEAAIHVRAQREIAPALRSAAFALDTNWPRRWVTSFSNPPIYPYPRPFENPSTSNFRGEAPTPSGSAPDHYLTPDHDQGLLPFAPAAGFVDYNPSYPSSQASAVAPTNGYIVSQSCFWESSAWVCEGIYHEDTGDPTLPVRVQMTVTFNNVAMGFRTLDASKMTMQAREDDGVSTWQPVSITYRAEMNDGSAGSSRPHGSVTFRFWATMPNIDAMGWITQAEFRIRIDPSVIADHCILTTTATNCAGADTSWFARNQWHRNAYYAVARRNTPAVLPRGSPSYLDYGDCTTSDCLRLNDSATKNVRVLLVLAGRRLDTQSRPNNTLLNYLELQNADAGTLYEQRPVRPGKIESLPVNAPWNDRIVLVDTISAPLVPTQIRAAPNPMHVSSLP